MTLQRPDESLAFDIPDSDHAIVAGRSQNLPAVYRGAKDYRTHTRSRGLQLAHQLSVAYLPESHCLISAAGSKELSVGTESNSTNLRRGIVDCQHDLAGRCVPKIDGLVPAPRRDQFAVGTESYTVDFVVMIFKPAEQSSGLHIA